MVTVNRCAKCLHGGEHCVHVWGDYPDGRRLVVVIHWRASAFVEEMLTGDIHPVSEYDPVNGQALAKYAVPGTNTERWKELPFA